jgi:hypothetical protein
MSLKLCNNGLLVASYDHYAIGTTYSLYKGVEPAWPLAGDNTPEAMRIHKGLWNHVYRSPDYDGVEVSTSFELSLEYFRVCQKTGFQKSVLLFCETTVPKPLIPDSEYKKFKDRLKFLGFDYAWSGGDFTSAVREDIGEVESHSGVTFRNLLNKNGLFEKEEDVLLFASEREKAVRDGVDLESASPGEYVVFKLYEVFIS